MSDVLFALLFVYRVECVLTLLFGCSCFGVDFLLFGLFVPCGRTSYFCIVSSRCVFIVVVLLLFCCCVRVVWFRLCVLVVCILCSMCVCFVVLLLLLCS